MSDLADQKEFAIKLDWNQPLIDLIKLDGQNLYPKTIDKAAAIFESIISNHPFIDGNKRTAYVLMRLIIKLNGQDIQSQEDEKYDFVLQAAQGKLKFDEIRGWIKSKLK